MEKALENFLEFNLELLEAGLKFYERQHPTSTGPLDILAKDSKGRWVIIELKKGRAGEKAVGQVLRYRAFIIKEKANGRANLVRAFVVTPEPDNRLINAAQGASPLLIEVFEFIVRGKAKRIFPS